MKFDVLYNFISPVTGRILATTNYVLVGNDAGIAIPSPDLIDLKLDLINLRVDFDVASSASYIIGFSNSRLPNAQVLYSLSDGFIFNTSGVISTFSIIPIGSLPDLPMGNIWIGNDMNRPVPNPTISIDNLPNLATKNIWIGNDMNRPTPNPTISIDNLPDLSSGKIWVGNVLNRPIASNYTPFNNKLTYIVKTASTSLPNAQALDELDDGVMINIAGVISTNDDYVKFEGSSVISGNIAIFADSTGKIIEDSDTSIPDLEELVEEAETAAEEAQTSAEEAAASAEEATAAAEEATTAAGEASAAAGEASAAAGEATTAAGAALVSAGLASISSSSASSSASDASDSATAAAASAIAATGSATAAAGSATAAAGSATAAAASATTAAIDATAAAGSATAAAIDATAAAGSATAAANSETKCNAALSEFLSTNITLTGDVTGSGLVASPIVTTLNMTLDQINAPVANLNLNNHNIINLLDPTTAQQAATKNYVDNTLSAYVLSVSGTTGKISSTGSQNVVLNLIPTTVTAGDYTNTDLTVDSDGRITAANTGLKGVLAALYMMGNITVTQILVADTYYKIAGATTTTITNNFTAPLDNKFVYTGTNSITALVRVDLAATPTAASVLSISIFKNNSQVATANYNSQLTAGSPISLTVGVPIQFATNDYVEVFITSNIIDDITVSDMNFQVII